VLLGSVAMLIAAEESWAEITKGEDSTVLTPAANGVNFIL
jgi:hypothetical protein